eukprot:3525784-Prymnesium_polylepis.1
MGNMTERDPETVQRGTHFDCKLSVGTCVLSSVSAFGGCLVRAPGRATASLLRGGVVQSEGTFLSPERL